MYLRKREKMEDLHKNGRDTTVKHRYLFTFGIPL